MLVRPLPTLEVDNLKMLPSVRITSNPYKHLRVFVHPFVVKNISPHSVVAGGQRLPLFLVRQHSGNYSVRSRKRIAIRRTKSGGRKQQKESTDNVLSSHNQN
jgi:hypothetical protein